MTKEISSQEEFEAIKGQFNSSSDYRNFSRRYHFNPKSRIERTGMHIDEALTSGSKPSTHGRRAIFEAMNSGVLVSLFNSSARHISRDATDDADIFIALYRGFIRLVPPE